MEPDKLLDEDPAVAHSIVGYSPRSTPTSISPLLETVVGFSSLQPLSPLWPVLDHDLDLDDFDIEHIGSELPSAEPAGDNKATSSAGSGSFGSGSHKKLDHNAYERDRRKKLNDTYSSLRSLLPDVDQNHNKKLSIPTTVCQVLEYIPKLKKQVEDLEKKKEELTRAKCKLGMARTNDGTTPIVSATPLDDKQVMIQVSLLKNTAENLPLSKCIQVLENEGLQLVGSSTFSTFDSSRTFYTLHLQKSQGTMDRVCPTLLCGKLEKAVKGKR